MQRFISLIAILIVVLGVLSPAWADEVVLNNGDRLTGTIGTLADGKLTFNSAQSGTVTIAVTNIRSLKVEKPVKLILKDRTQAQTTLTPGVEGQVQIEVGGQVRTIALADIALINPAVFRWNSRIAANLNLIDNLVDSQTLNITGATIRTTPRTETSFDAALLRSKQGGTDTENAGFLNGSHNFGKDRPIHGYLNGALRTDKIQKLDLRIILGGGVSFELVQKPTMNYRLNTGLSFRSEDFKEASIKTRLAGELGYDFKWILTAATTFIHDLTFLPALSDLADNYLLIQFGLNQDLTSKLYASLQAILDNTSRPGPGAAKSTSKLLIGLGLRF